MPLTEKEREVTLAVLHRFLNLHEPSPHKLLVRQCKDPKIIEHLMRVGVLGSFSGEPVAYLPRAIAFHHSGDADTLRRAKAAATITIKILKNLFEVELEKDNFTPDDVVTHARKICDIPPSIEEIKLGLFLIAEFPNVLRVCGFNSAHTEMVSLQFNDNIVALSDVDGMWDRHVAYQSRFVEGEPDSLEMEEDTEIAESPSLPLTHGGLLIFISHSSKDAELAQALIDLLRTSLGLRADQIRCSSVDGYRLPVGVNTEDQLRNEVNATKAVIGLVTPSSLQSSYVMFELGARWGAKSFMAPLLVGVQPSDLRGPLSLLNALSANNEAQLHQLLGNISERLRLPLENPSSYLRHISIVKGLADTTLDVKSPKGSDKDREGQVTEGKSSLIREVPVARPRSNIVFIEATSTTAHSGEREGTLYESPQRLGDFSVAVVRFRNNAIVGVGVEEPSVTCHILYTDRKGKEITDVSRAVWLDHYGESVDFETGKRKSVIVFLLSNQGTLKKLWNESYFTSTSWMAGGKPSFRIRDEGVRSDVASIEVSLLSGASCVLRAIFTVEREKDKLPELKLKSVSGER